jgi:AhpD family alkylhydroperoxidase
MQTIPSVQIDAVSDATQRLLELDNAGQRNISNMLKAMAQSHKTLDGYLYFVHALEMSSLDPLLSEQIALTVAQVDQCDYSLVDHAARARRLGLGEEEILAAREGRVPNKNTEAVLRFARGLIRRNGEHDLADLRKHGYTDRAIVDIIACVALNVFTNMFNLVAKPDVDFREVERNVRVA